MCVIDYRNNFQEYSNVESLIQELEGCSNFVTDDLPEDWFKRIKEELYSCYICGVWHRIEKTSDYFVRNEVCSTCYENGEVGNDIENFV